MRGSQRELTCGARTSVTNEAGARDQNDAMEQMHGRTNRMATKNSVSEGQKSHGQSLAFIFFYRVLQLLLGVEAPQRAAPGSGRRGPPVRSPRWWVTLGIRLTETDQFGSSVFTQIRLSQK